MCESTTTTTTTLWLNRVLTHGIRPAFPDGVHIIYRQPRSDQSPVYWIALLHSDGVHSRKSAGTGQVDFNVTRVTGNAFSGFTLDHFLCASLFLHSPSVQYVVELHVWYRHKLLDRVSEARENSPPETWVYPFT